MKRQFKTQPSSYRAITASSMSGVSWQDIFGELKDASNLVHTTMQETCFPDTDRRPVYDEIKQSADKMQQLLQASKQLNQAIHDAISIYERQVNGIKAGDYIRVVDDAEYSSQELLDLLIESQMEQAAENYGNERSDEELYEIAYEHVVWVITEVDPEGDMNYTEWIDKVDTPEFKQYVYDKCKEIDLYPYTKYRDI